jgi:hypothetical protein
MIKLDHLQAKKAENKFGLLNRLNINQEVYDNLDTYLKDVYVSKQLISECAPVEVRRRIEECNDAYAKLIEINNKVDCEDFGAGVYYHEPEILRGAQRKALGRKKNKDLAEEAYEREIEAFRLESE